MNAPSSPSDSAAESAADAAADSAADAAAAFIEALDQAAERHDVDADGSRVAWRRFGSGPPLVLLHGGHGRWLHWALNIQAWARQHTVWVPDLPGYGDSDLPPAPSLTSLVDHLGRSLDTLLGSATPVRLAGFSFGGLAAAALAARRGAVTHLALFGPGGHGGPRRPRGELRAWRGAWERHDTPALAQVMRHNLAMHMLHDPAAVDALALRIHTDACVQTRFRSREISRAGGLGAVLRGYHGPLLLAWGEHDVTAVPATAGAELAQGRGDARTLIVPGAGHWVAYERAALVNRLLSDWLAGATDLVIAPG